MCGCRLSAGLWCFGRRARCASRPRGLAPPRPPSQPLPATGRTRVQRRPPHMDSDPHNILRAFPCPRRAGFAATLSLDACPRSRQAVSLCLHAAMFRRLLGALGEDSPSNRRAACVGVEAFQPPAGELAHDSSLPLPLAFSSHALCAGVSSLLSAVKSTLWRVNYGGALARGIWTLAAAIFLASASVRRPPRPRPVPMLTVEAWVHRPAAPWFTPRRLVQSQQPLYSSVGTWSNERRHAPPSTSSSFATPAAESRGTNSSRTHCITSSYDHLPMHSAAWEGGGGESAVR